MPDYLVELFGNPSIITDAITKADLQTKIVNYIKANTKIIELDPVNYDAQQNTEIQNSKVIIS